MRKRFDEQLKELNLEMQEMGRMVEDGIQKAIEALLKQDENLAQAVMDADALVDQKQKEIESICFDLPQAACNPIIIKVGGLTLSAICGNLFNLYDSSLR